MRHQRLASVSLGLTLAYALAALKFASKTTILSPVFDFVLIFITSAGLYKLVVNVICSVVGSSEFLLRLYWGRLHVAGLWSYSYTLEDSEDDTVYFGVWRFEQNLFGTSVVGFGLTDDYRVRSHVRSVTDMLDNGNAYEFVNVRSDSIDSSAEYYSRTTMFFELSGRHFLRRPIRMRGKTFVYGGPRSGGICSNFFVRHEKARTEQDVIDIIRSNIKNHGHVHPTPP